jgi:hypothetical protein
LRFFIRYTGKRGFGGRWIKYILHKGFVGMIINNVEGEFF